jgi:hypothetical protein
MTFHPLSQISDLAEHHHENQCSIWHMEMRLRFLTQDGGTPKTNWSFTIGESRGNWLMREQTSANIAPDFPFIKFQCSRWDKRRPVTSL